MGFGRFSSQCGATMYQEFAVIVREERISIKKAPFKRGLLKIAIGAEDINIHLISKMAGLYYSDT